MLNIYSLRLSELNCVFFGSWGYSTASDAFLHLLHPLPLVSLPIAQKSFAWWKKHPFLESYRSGLKSGPTTYWLWAPERVIFFHLNLSVLICYRGQCAHLAEDWRTSWLHCTEHFLSARPAAKHVRHSLRPHNTLWDGAARQNLLQGWKHSTCAVQHGSY